MTGFEKTMLQEDKTIQAEEVWMDATTLTLLLVAQLPRLDLLLWTLLLTCFLFIRTKSLPVLGALQP